MPVEIGYFSKLYGDGNIIGRNNNDKSLVSVVCSEPGCGVEGMAYVDKKSKNDKSHFCIDHNPKITNTRKFDTPEAHYVGSTSSKRKVTSVHPNNIGTRFCPCCSKKLHSRTSYNLHMQYNHPNYKGPDARI